MMRGSVATRDGKEAYRQHGVGIHGKVCNALVPSMTSQKLEEGTRKIKGSQLSREVNHKDYSLCWPMLLIFSSPS